MESSGKSLLLIVVLLGAAGAFVGRKQLAVFFEMGKSSAQSALMDSENVSLVQGGEILVEAFGKPYVSEEAFNKKLKQLLKSSQYTKEMDPETFPVDAKAKFLKDWVNFLLIKDVWGKEKNLEQDEAFKARCVESFEAIRDSLIIDTFVQSLKETIVVSDDDVAVEYSSNKDNYIKSRGGSRFAVAEFAIKAQAQKLQSQLSGVAETKDFAALAENLDGIPVEIGYIDGKGSSLNAVIGKYPTEVRRLFYAKTVDPVSLVSEGDRHYVVFATEKKSATYYELDEIAPRIKAMLEENLHKNALEKALDEMMKKANVTLHEDVFEKKSKSPKPRIINKKELQQLNDELDGEFEEENPEGHVH
ncbi:hypothetical protein FJ366_00900 [Candidatus Dependentiae bacterium]|nr:hypothetical protein [Candidatus Dependentiae bacterium]